MRTAICNCPRNVRRGRQQTKSGDRRLHCYFADDSLTVAIVLLLNTHSVSMLFWLWGERGPGKMWPWGGGSEILTENVASGRSRKVLGRFSGGSREVLGHKKCSKPRNYHARSVYKKTGMETGANFAWKLPSDIQK